MPHEVIMPALGMAQETGLIVAWHKSHGDAVKAGDVLFEVETDKATMEVEAQVDGVVTDIRHAAGDEVPVGEVIALIGNSTDPVQPAETQPDKAPPTTDMPDGNKVIMPALGMAQDTGLIVAWHKAPGDPVAAGETLFEVETDKSTMEVEAEFDGYVAALLAEAGEEAPVGETIAVISTEKPEHPVQTAQRARAASSPVPKAVTAPQTVPKSAPARPTPSARPVPGNGRILASPKTRRLALEQGLDLNRLVAAGHPQPFHVADLEVLRSLPSEPVEAPQSAARRLTADVPVDGFSDFASWAAEGADLRDAGALLAGLAAAGLRRNTANVDVEILGQARRYTVPAGPLGAVMAADGGATPDLRLRDLRLDRISSVRLGAEDVPVLTLTRSGEGLAITLECASHHLTAAEAVSLLSEFAGRMEQPLRHLL